MIGIILAGGHSRRFGQDKALYKVPGQPLTNVEVAVNNLLPFCDDILVSANQLNFDQLTNQFSSDRHVMVIQDQLPFIDLGPLSGIYAATCRFPELTDYLLLAVDYPFITQSILATVANINRSYAASTNLAQYTISHFDTCQTEMTAYLQRKDWALKDFIKGYKQCDPVSFAAPSAFTNLNEEPK